MEGVSARMHRKMKGYWSRSGYERINGSGRIRRNRPAEMVFGDAYVKMMLRFGNSRAIGDAGYGDRIAAFGARPIKEYDDKMIAEIYKSLVMAQGQSVPRDASRFGSMPKLTPIVE
ncbi:hypothetical protein OIU85_020334 [Salix viminalis]|uniref:Uncharacterized protein n=1 Tax=Salix viminalis TaxID=40686 RepID=A0A9Q0UG12_SALVM|nr:hypothetical protein OIU85_020334 [Salix viminalis]